MTVTVNLDDGRSGRGDRPWCAVVDAVTSSGPDTTGLAVAVEPTDRGDKWTARRGRWWTYRPDRPAEAVHAGRWTATDDAALRAATGL